MAYSVMTDGKRLRPLLFLTASVSLGREITEKEIQVACGTELIHAYPLIHDDLPAMDNDDYRRGVFTSHKKRGEIEAILAGDALLPMGLERIVSAGNTKMVAVAASTTGPNGMAGGQHLNIDLTNNDTVREDNNLINWMRWLKIDCLIEASIEIAATYAKADGLSRRELADSSVNLGRAYQIHDDLADVVQTSREAGKVAYKNEEEDKNNTLALLGIDESRRELQELILTAKNNLTDLDSEVLLGSLNLYRKVL